MSLFPGADLSDDSPCVSPNTVFLGTLPSPSPRPPQHYQQGNMEPDTVPNGLPAYGTSSWYTSEPQGLGLINLPVTMETSHGAMAAMSNAPYYHTTMSFASASQSASSRQPTACQLPTRKDSWNDQSYDPFSTMPVEPLYDHHQYASLSVVGYEASPGRSEYSRSSHPSAVSSPCAHSNYYIPPAHSPQFKIEYPTIPQFRFLSAEGHFQQPGVVNPGDIMKIDETTIEERVRQSLSSSSSSDHGDCQPSTQRLVHRRPHSVGDFGNLTLNGRIKRTYTKPENANFRCYSCGRAFQRAYNLKSHLANVHNRHRARQHPCESDGCTKTFVRRTDLTRHEESVHLKLRNFKCSLCERDFSRRDTLTRHEEDGCPNRQKAFDAGPRSIIGKRFL